MLVLSIKKVIVLEFKVMISLLRMSMMLLMMLIVATVATFFIMSVKAF